MFLKTHTLHYTVGDFVPYRFSVPFGGIQTTQVNVVETVIKPLTCKTSDTAYVSEEQCIVRQFFSEEFSPCPVKCIPIQMKGFR